MQKQKWRMHPTFVSVGPSGFSLVEVIVVIGIIGLLSSVVLPAVQSVRSRGIRLQCSNNMKQLGIAAHTYHSTFGTFPGGNSPMVQILPSLDQAALAEQIMANIFSPTTPFDRGGRVATFICPGDSIADLHRGSVPSYLLNGGSGLQKFGWNGSVSRVPGVADAGFLTTANFTDGLSQTSLMSELLVSENGQAAVVFANSDEKKRRFSAFTVNALWQAIELDQFAMECTNSPQWPAPNTFMPRGDTIIGTPVGYHHILTPNQNSCLNGSPVLSNARVFQAVTSNSTHVGGVNVLLGDGSIRFVHDSIDRGVWRSLGSRNGSDSTNE